MAYKVLVIDDSAVIRKLLCEVLTDIGFQVDTADNGLVGYEMAQKDDYTLIFCDIHMPVMNGLRAVQKIKQIKHDVPVIMTDSFPDKLARQATEAGALCCLAKPFSLDELRETINSIIKNEKITVK